MASVNGYSFAKQGEGEYTSKNNSLILKAKKGKSITLTGSKEIEYNKKVTLKFDKQIFSKEKVLLQVRLDSVGAPQSFHFSGTIYKNNVFQNQDYKNFWIERSNDDPIVSQYKVTSNGDFIIEVQNKLNGYIKFKEQEEAKQSLNSAKNLKVSIKLENKSDQQVSIKFLEYSIA